MKVYIDGQFVEEDQAKLSVFDAGVQHGVGLFETMRAYGGRVFRVEAHIDRLIESARQTGLTDQLRRDPLCEAVELTLKKNKLPDARVRLTVTGGNLSWLGAAQGQKAARHQPSIVIAATEPTVYPEALLTEGAAAVIADPKLSPFDPLAGHKTLNYWSRLRAVTQAAAARAAEALWFTVTNHLAGGSVSNAFIIKAGQIATPIARGQEPEGAIPSPVLPGITRAAVIELAERLDVPVHRKMLTINDILEADEVFLTNSSWLILPIVKVEKETIGPGKPGELTRQLYDELLKVIASECAAVEARA